jgi:hypothetical protein
MRVTCSRQATTVVFLLTEVDPRLEPAARTLGLEPMEGGFGRDYPSDHPHIDHIFHNFAANIESLLRQKARLLPVSWEQALLTFCRIVEGEPIDWWLTGSAALAVRGLPVAPGDLDLIVSRESSARLEELMLPYIVEPPRPGFISDTFTRAFLHACVEWCAGIDERADQHLVGDVGLEAQRRLETVPWQGYTIRVPSLDLQLAVNRARGLHGRVALIEQLIEQQQ